MFKIKQIYVSSGHSYFGRHNKGAENHSIEAKSSVHCVENRGIEGDRFFDHKDNYKGQITFFAQEVFDALCAHLKVKAESQQVRRNVITVGQDLNELIGKTFEVQNVLFEGTEECSPCYWMDQAIAPGAKDFLKGQGGLRCRILNTGWLKIDA